MVFQTLFMLAMLSDWGAFGPLGGGGECIPAQGGRGGWTAECYHQGLGAEVGGCCSAGDNGPRRHVAGLHCAGARARRR